MLKGENFIKLYPSEVKEIGLHEAVIVSFIRSWIETNEKSKKNFLKEKYWTYFTYEQLQDQTGVSKDTMRPKVINLEKLGIVLSGNFNKRKNDRTKWYSLSDNYNDIINKAVVIESNKSIDENDHVDCLNTSHQSDSFDATLPKNTYNDKQNTSSNINIIDKDYNEVEDFKNQLIAFTSRDITQFKKEEEVSIKVIEILFEQFGVDKSVNLLLNNLRYGTIPEECTFYQIELIKSISKRLKNTIILKSQL